MLMAEAFVACWRGRPWWDIRVLYFVWFYPVFRPALVKRFDRDLPLAPALWTEDLPVWDG